MSNQGYAGAPWATAARTKRTSRTAGATAVAAALLLLLCRDGVAAEIASAASAQAGYGFYGSPELQGLVDALTFHLSFDGASLTPDLAGGEKYTPALQCGAGQAAPPEFAPGISGQALVLGTGAGLFPSAGNLTLGRCGAIALWVKPLAWQRPNGSNSVFLMTSDSLFYLQRQGPLRDADGRITRHEAVQYLAKSSRADRQFTGLMAGAWENGGWHFLVANWSWPQMQLSIDGGAFAVQALPTRPAEGGFAAFLVGATGGDRGLLDEVMAFSRPLSLEEIRRLQTALSPPP